MESRFAGSMLDWAEISVHDPMRGSPPGAWKAANRVRSRKGRMGASSSNQWIAGPYKLRESTRRRMRMFTRTFRPSFPEGICCCRCCCFSGCHSRRESAVAVAVAVAVALALALAVAVAVAVAVALALAVAFLVVIPEGNLLLLLLLLLPLPLLLLLLLLSLFWLSFPKGICCCSCSCSCSCCRFSGCHSRRESASAFASPQNLSSPKSPNPNKPKEIDLSD